MIFAPEYWPVFKTDEKRIFRYSAPDQAPIISVFDYDAKTDSMRYLDYANGWVWKDTWFYQYRSGFGIAEWRDDYPYTILGKQMIKNVVMNPPIGWGEWLDIGVPYQNSPKMDPLKSFPPQIAQGFQVVVLEAVHDVMTVAGRVYNDVIQFVYDQTWNGKSGGGARYYMAKGVGPIAISWKTPQNVFSTRMDATVEIQR